MKSGGFSFKKKNKENTAESTIYFGCPDLDFILNYSLARSSLICIDHDELTNHHVSLVRYFLGYGQHHQQNCVLYDNLVDRWSRLVPKEIEKRKLAELKKRKDNLTSDKNQKSTIAWRYDKMKIKFKAFTTRSDYIFLDLSKNVDFNPPKKQADENTVVQNNEAMKDLFNLVDLDKFKSLKDLYLNIENEMQNIQESPNDIKAKRLVVNNLGSFMQPNFLDKSESKASICRFMNALKTLLRSTHAVCILVIPKSGLVSENLRTKIASYADLYLSMEILHNSKTFTDFSGTLNIMKISPLMRFKQYPIEHNVYGFKAGKTEMEIELLYENSLAVTESNTSDVKKASGLCQPQNNKKLEF